jgi:hypothetical protein
MVYGCPDAHGQPRQVITGAIYQILMPAAAVLFGTNQARREIEEHEPR